MGTRNDPGRFDCAGKAEDDEPTFTLLGRDEHAPMLVDSWAKMREMAIERGTRPEKDRAKVEEARACADAMRAFKRVRDGREVKAPDAAEIAAVLCMAFTGLPLANAASVDGERVMAEVRAQDPETARIIEGAAAYIAKRFGEVAPAPTATPS